MAIDILTLALAKKMSGSSGGSAIQSDWNQNDETASDYVKNRTHWEEVTTKTVGVTREFSATSADGGYIEDLEFAKLLWEHRKDAAYVVNGADGVYSRDVPLGNDKYRWGVYANNREIWVWLNVDENEEFTGKIWMGDNGFGAFYEGTITIEVEETETTIHTIDPKYLPDSAKSDWNQNDPTAPDYIKNRPFWTGDPVEKTLFNNDFDIDNLYYDGTPLGLEIGKTYTVCLNEDSYDVVCVGIDGGCFLGNGSLQDIGEDTGEPFVVIESVDHNVFSACVAESYFIQLLESGKDPIVSLEIFGSHKEVTTIDAKYLPVGGRMRRGAMSFGDVVPTEGLEIFVGTTTYASFINHLQSSAIPIFYLDQHGLGGNAMTALVFSYDFSIVGEIGNEACDVTLSVFDLTYGFSGKIYVTFPLNADNAVDDDSAVESIQFSAPESMVLESSTPGSDKKFKITVDDSGTLKATELT